VIVWHFVDKERNLLQLTYSLRTAKEEE